MRSRGWSVPSLGAPQTWPQPLRGLVDLMLDSKVPMFLAWGEELAFLYNDACAQILSARHPAALGRRLHDVWREICPDLSSLAGAAMKGEAACREDLPLLINRKGSDEQAWFTFSCSPVRDGHGAVAGVLCVVAETTQAVLSRRSLRESDERHRLVVDSASDYAIVTLDAEGIITSWNSGAHAMFGYAAEEAVGQSLDILFTPSDRTAGVAREEIRRARECGRAENECWHLRKDGSRFWGSGLLQPLANEQVPGYVAILRDRTAQRLAQSHRQALVELSDQIRDVQDPDILLCAAAAILGRTLRVSRAGYGTIDAQAETLTIVRDWIAPGAMAVGGTLSFASYGSYFGHLNRGETVAVNDVRLDPRTAANAHAFEMVKTRAFVNFPVMEQGHLVSQFFLLHDEARAWTQDEIRLLGEVAERTYTAVERLYRERELRASEARYRALFNSIDEGFCVIEFIDGEHGPLSDYVHVEANPAYTSNAGIPDIVGKRLREIVSRSEADAWADIYRRVLITGTPIRFERELVESGRHLELAAFRAGTEERRQVAVLFKDVSGRKQAEDQLRQLNLDLTERVARAVAEREAAMFQMHEMQKLETIGQLSGGIAHDFNNLLTPIVGSLDMLQGKLRDDPRSARMVLGAQQAAERARLLVSRLLTFARRQHLDSRPVDVAELADGMIDLIRRTIGPQIEVVIDIARAMPPAKVDPHQLELALLNLCVNARDAMPGGGRLTIAADSVDEDDTHPSSPPPGRYAKLRVTDNGQGMDAETLRRATEPFFTTKGVGKGTGLGLSMVQGLAVQSGGALNVGSVHGEGTTVTIWLPVAEEAAREQSLRRTDEVPETSGTRSILLVDDESLILECNAQMLESLGQQVSCATSAAAALALLRAGQHFDLLLTDYMMPGMTGLDLIRQARQLRPDLPAGLVTGFATGVGEGEGIAILSKPFRLADLARFLEKVSDSKTVR